MGSNPEFWGDDESRDLEGGATRPTKVLDSNVMGQRLEVLPKRAPLVFAGSGTVSEAMRAMQRERRGCVLITEDGTDATRMIGIFTERDVLYRIVDRGRNPATLPLSEVMTADPEWVPLEASVAWVLNQMAVGGFRHVPVVDTLGRPAFVISVRDVVELLVEFFPEEILNLPPRYGADHASKREGA